MNAPSLDELYAEFLGNGAGDMMLDNPAFAAPPFPPAWAQTIGMGEPPESAQVDPMLGVTPAFGATTTAPAQYGYSPQPRPALPAPLAPPEDPAADLYGPFRSIWQGMQAQPEQDPLEALMAQMGPPEEPQLGVGDPRVPALPWEAAPQANYGAQRQPSRQEQAFAGRHPRVMERMNWLRNLRTQKGM